MSGTEKKTGKFYTAKEVSSYPTFETGDLTVDIVKDKYANVAAPSELAKNDSTLLFLAR